MRTHLLIRIGGRQLVRGRHVKRVAWVCLCSLAALLIAGCMPAATSPALPAGKTTPAPATVASPTSGSAAPATGQALPATATMVPNAPPIAPPNTPTAATATGTGPARAATATMLPNAPPNAPVAATTQAATATPAPVADQLPPPYGVSVRGEINDPAVQSLMREAGVRWLRSSLSWASVEPSPGVFRWDELDNLMRVISASGAVPVVYVAGNPAWAATSICGPIDKVPPSELARFAGQLAGRYNGKTIANGRLLPAITYWQFYNEPDNRFMTGDAAGFDGCWGEYGVDYARMLDMAWTAIHAANPQAKVVFGGIAAELVDCPATWSCAGEMIFNFNPGGGDFLDDVLNYMRSAPRSTVFDIFDFHYYPTYHRAFDAYGAGLTGKAAYLRDRLQASGVTRPFLSTEASRRSDPKQVIDGVPGSDIEQSRYVIRLFVQAQAAGLLNLHWFTLTDIVAPAQGGFAAWGLLGMDLKPKPSYVTYKLMTKELDGFAYRGTLDVGQNVEAYSFTKGLSETVVIWTTGANANVTLRGSQMTVVDMQGRATLVVDGGAGDLDKATDGAVTLTATADPVYVRRLP